MTEKRFACTSCGKCCYGILPLTLSEAIGGADSLPLAISLTPVRQDERHFDLTLRLGTCLQVSKRQKMAVLAAPVAYLPATMPCPKLSPDNLCSIHESKPLRCRAMPFYSYYEEDQQADFLVPRKGWLCNTTESAPVVYREKKILDRSSFEAERAALLEDAPALRTYVDTLFRSNPAVLGQFMKAAQGRSASRIFLGFSSFLRLDRRMSLAAFALRQHKVLEDWARRTAADPSLAAHYAYYRAASAELVRYL